MYTIQVEVQIGNQFTAKLFKNDKYIGGIGNDKNEVYRRHLNFTVNLLI